MSVILSPVFSEMIFLLVLRDFLVHVHGGITTSFDLTDGWQMHLLTLIQCDKCFFPSELWFEFWVLLLISSPAKWRWAVLVLRAVFAGNVNTVPFSDILFRACAQARPTIAAHFPLCLWENPVVVFRASHYRLCLDLPQVIHSTSPTWCVLGSIHRFP